MCNHDVTYKIQNEQFGGVGCPLCNAQKSAAKPAQKNIYTLVKEMIETKKAFSTTPVVVFPNSEPKKVVKMARNAKGDLVVWVVGEPNTQWIAARFMSTGWVVSSEKEYSQWVAKVK